MFLICFSLISGSLDYTHNFGKNDISGSIRSIIFEPERILRINSALEVYISGYCDNPF